MQTTVKSTIKRFWLWERELNSARPMRMHHIGDWTVTKNQYKGHLHWFGFSGSDTIETLRHQEQTDTSFMFFLQKSWYAKLCYTSHHVIITNVVTVVHALSFSILMAVKQNGLLHAQCFHMWSHHSQQYVCYAVSFAISLPALKKG